MTNKLAALLENDVHLYISATGAGAGIQKSLWEVPGISKILVGASFPYAKEATDDFLGFPLEKYCCEDAAIHLAMESYKRAFQYGTKAVGIGLTASVSSLQDHRGAHRVFVAACTDTGVRLASSVLDKSGATYLIYDRDRLRQRDGDFCDNFALELIQSVVLGTDCPHTVVDDQARELLLQRPFFKADGTRGLFLDFGKKFILYPGSFNPPHEGHFGIAQALQEKRLEPARTLVFSITSNPPHKPEVTVAEMLQRAKMLKGHDVLFSSGDALFVDKIKKYPESDFIVGVDTLLRMLDPKYGVDPEDVGRLIEDSGCTIWVVPRLIDGTIGNLTDVQLPSRGHFISLDYRKDISSSEIRAKNNKP